MWTVPVFLLFLLFNISEDGSTDPRTGDARTGRRGWFGSSILFAAASSSSWFSSSTSKKEDDLYQILGVPRSASIREIKKAYRKKALDTHPDKNQGVPAEEAAAAFHKVVHAFEVLSDATSRNRYDRTGRTDGGSSGSSGSRNHHHHQQQQRQQRGNHNHGGGFRWTFSWSNSGGGRFHRVQPLKDRFDVKQAQSRILHIVSLEQLETIMTTIPDDDDNDNDSTNTNDLVLERNLLICFYTPPLEQHLMEEMVYPWPFAAMSSQGIWWEDLLQTTVVRYHNSNELTKFFDIPSGADLKQPVFLYGKKGQSLRDKEAWNRRRLSTDQRQVFDHWVWQQLEVNVTFVNEHDHPVELYWIHDKRASLKGMVSANGGRLTLTSMLAHEWWARDARTDTEDAYNDPLGRHKLTEATCLANLKILSDDASREYVIPRGTCYDKSGHCPFWNRSKECDRNPVFMHDVCRRTCQRCVVPTEEEEKKKNSSSSSSSSSSGSDEL